MITPSEGGFHLNRLRREGCVRIKVTDPKQLPRERLNCLRMATKLGRALSSSYHYPWLYAVLGERVPMDVGIRAAEGTLRRNRTRRADPAEL